MPFGTSLDLCIGKVQREPANKRLSHLGFAGGIGRLTLVNNAGRARQEISGYRTLL
jgi:hypothetical protein